MQIRFAQIINVEMQLLRLAAQIAERGLRAFLHHVAERAGEGESPGAGHARRLDEKYLPAHRRPRESHRDAGLGDLLRDV